MNKRPLPTIGQRTHLRFSKEPLHALLAKRIISRRQKVALLVIGVSVVMCATALWYWGTQPNLTQDQATADDLFTLQQAIDKQFQYDKNPPMPQSLQDLHGVTLKRNIANYKFKNTTEYFARSSTYTLCAVFTAKHGNFENLTPNTRAPQLGDGRTNVYTTHREGEQCYHISNSVKGNSVAIELRKEDVVPLPTVQTDFAQYSADVFANYQAHMQTLGTTGSEKDLNKICYNSGIAQPAYHCNMDITRELPILNDTQTRTRIDALLEQLRTQGFRDVRKEEGITAMEGVNNILKKYPNYVSVNGIRDSCSLFVSYDPDRKPGKIAYYYICSPPLSPTLPNGFPERR